MKAYIPTKKGHRTGGSGASLVKYLNRSGMVLSPLAALSASSISASLFPSLFAFKRNSMFPLLKNPRLVLGIANFSGESIGLTGGFPGLREQDGLLRPWLRGQSWAAKLDLILITGGLPRERRGWGTAEIVGDIAPVFTAVPPLLSYQQTARLGGERKDKHFVFKEPDLGLVLLNGLKSWGP